MYLLIISLFYSQNSQQNGNQFYESEKENPLQKEKKNGFSDLKSGCYETILMEVGTDNGSYIRSRFQSKFSNFESV